MDESKSDSDSEASRSPVDYKENEGSQSSSHESNESDNEQNYSNEKNDPNSTTARALFGDADDISTEEEDEEDDVDDDGKSVSNQDVFQHSANESIDQSMDFETEQTNQLNNLQEFEYDQNDEDPDDEEHDIKSGIDKDLEPEPEPDPVIEVEIPKIMTDLGRELHFVKLPNFLSIDTRPFDPDTYEDEIDEEETLDEEGRARLKLKVENTIRWREITNDLGGKKRESNTRLVRWSDGSLSLHLGSEIFDVYKQPLQGDHNHLFIRQGTGLQGQAVFRTKLSFRPHSTESFTHRKMTLSLADRSQKVSGIKILSTIGNNPEQDRHILLKREEEKLKQTIRASKPRRKDVLNRSHNISRTYHEEEGSDEDGAISLAAIKNKYKSGTVNKTGTIYSSEEEDSDIEPIRSKKGDKSRALRNLESDSD